LIFNNLTEFHHAELFEYDTAIVRSWFLMSRPEKAIQMSK
jgi:hypothetical protein